MKDMKPQIQETLVNTNQVKSKEPHASHLQNSEQGEKS